MLELAASAGADNGDGVWDEKDSYGLAFNNFALISFFFSSGCRFITKDDSGGLTYDFGSDRQIEVLTKTVNFLNDQTMTLYGERYADKYQENGRVYVLTDAFKENRALFIPARQRKLLRRPAHRTRQGLLGKDNRGYGVLLP